MDEMGRHHPSSGEMPAADCPAEELEEEGLSLAECEHMVATVKGIALSAPDWFPNFQMVLSGIGTASAFLSTIVGASEVKPSKCCLRWTMDTPSSSSKRWMAEDKAGWDT
jgi:hypothetical protein